MSDNLPEAFNERIREDLDSLREYLSAEQVSMLDKGRLFKPDESALDAMNALEQNMTQIFPMGPDGEIQTPPELIGKSMEEIKAMGGREVT